MLKYLHPTGVIRKKRPPIISTFWMISLQKPTIVPHVATRGRPTGMATAGFPASPEAAKHAAVG